MRLRNLIFEGTVKVILLSRTDEVFQGNIVASGVAHLDAKTEAAGLRRDCDVGDPQLQHENFESRNIE